MNFNFSGELALINLTIFILFVYTFRKEYNNKEYYSNNSYLPLVFFVLSYSVLGYAEADTYHYEYLYNEMLLAKRPIHVEPFYYWLIDFLPSNYYVWRCVIWGGALALLIATFQRFELKTRSIGFAFALLLVQQFTLTRGCLGISLFLYSMSFLIKPLPNFRLIHYVVAIIGCILSIFLHKSMILFILISFGIFLPIGKRTLWMMILAYPVLRSYVIPFVFDVLGSGFLSEKTTSFSTLYLEGEKSVANLNGMISLIIQYVARFTLFYVLIKKYIFGKEEVPRYITSLFRYSLVLFYVALLFVGQQTSSFVASRTLHMMCFPLTVVFAYYLATTRRGKLLKFSMLLILFDDILSMLLFVKNYW